MTKLSKKDEEFIKKILNEEAEEKAKLPRIKSELPNREGGKVIVEMGDGSEMVFFYVESGVMKGWTEE